ncbi:MAG: right-handed parallel beta-helix repeat-containing protein [Candidatus Moranbacteria bacterium]|nr:right-handed parallel beta-helix repeat-containing protein [Candidatus Moranbacteria bacterium]
MRFKFLVIVLFFLCVPFLSYAKEYDFYVDASASSGGDGSKASPFRKIADALEEAGKSASVFLMKGNYEEDVDLKNSIKLYGENEVSVVIIGDVTMGNNTRLDTLTVSVKKDPLIIFGDADVQIENCVVRNFEGTGIILLAGSGKVSIVDSRIKNGEGKGMYIERGRSVYIANNQVMGNGEEGIDVRSNVSGSIINNNIEDNGESGVEIIGEKVDLIVSGNKIKNNGANGIAFQYYPSLSGDGKVVVSENSISGNNKYGIDCNVPHGKGLGFVGYWERLIEMKENDIYSNKIKSINNFCMLSEKKKEEESENNIVESGFVEDEDGEGKNEISEEERLEMERIKEKERKKEEERLRKIEELKLKLGMYNDITNSVAQVMNEMRLRSKFSLFVFGVRDAELKNMEIILENSERQLDEIQGGINNFQLDEAEESALIEKVKERQKIIEAQLEFMDNQKNKFSIRGWFRNLFK